MISNTTCTSCGACAASCPKNCIHMKLDRLGQLVPVIDTKNCVDCGICKKVCPQNSPLESVKPIKCYAAWSKNKKDWTYSASGGAAAAFTRVFISDGGVVFGCDYDENGDLFHFAIDKVADIIKIQSSKYSQSSAYVCFSEIKSLVEKSKKVLFIGTPCQVAGLKKYLKKDYEFLVTVDLVCHGTPPNIYLKEYLKNLKIEFPISKIRFRGEYDQMLTVWKNNTIVYQQNRTEDVFFSAFYKNMISNQSCYNCIYAKNDRVSDITIGDFWGLGILNNINPMSSRPSLILINNDKGSRFFDEVSSGLIYEQREVDEAVRGNGRLNSPPGESKEAKIFQLLYKIGFRFDLSVRIVSKLKIIINKLRVIKSLLKRH